MPDTEKPTRSYLVVVRPRQGLTLTPASHKAEIVEASSRKLAAAKVSRAAGDVVYVAKLRHVRKFKRSRVAELEPTS